MREKQASFGREEAANWPVWKPLFGKNGLASPKGDLQTCSEVGNSRGRVLVPDCPLPALQRHSQILELFSMKVKATGVCQTWQAPYWPQLSYYLSIQTRTKAYFMKGKGLLLSKLKILFSFAETGLTWRTPSYGTSDCRRDRVTASIENRAGPSWRST